MSEAIRSKSANARTSNAGLASLVKELSSSLERAVEQLGDAPGNTTRDKRRRAKPRKGSEKVFALLAPIVRQNNLDSGALNSAEMIARSEAAQTLVPLLLQLQKVTKRVADEVFDAETDAWEMGLQFYALLRRRAKNDGQLAVSVEPLSRVFCYRHPSVKEEQPTKMQTRVKAQLRRTMALAERHGVSVPATRSHEAEPQGETDAPVVGVRSPGA